jgi:large subunit ribosomal protein L35
MPKMKSKRALMKRIKITKSGKVFHKAMNTGHLATGKTTKQKRHLRKSREIHKSDIKRIKALINF